MTLRPLINIGLVPKSAHEGQETEDDARVALRRPHPGRVRLAGRRSLGKPPLPGNFRGGGRSFGGSGGSVSLGAASAAATSSGMPSRESPADAAASSRYNN